MRAVLFAVAPLAIAAVLVVSGSAQVNRDHAGDFSAAALTAPPTTGWPTNGGNLYNQRYSPLDGDQPRQRRAAEGRVAHAPARLGHRRRSTRAKRSRSSTTAWSTSSTGANDVFALSIDTGEILWQYAANLDAEHHRRSAAAGPTAASRSATTRSSSASSTASSSRSISATGKVAWSIQAERWQDDFSITAAPLYYDGLVITGFAGADRGTRGRVKAYDAKDGKLVWTFYTIPGPGEPGHDTWPKDNDAWKYGGALGLADAGRRPRARADLFLHRQRRAPTTTARCAPATTCTPRRSSRSTPTTGKYRWHFQQVHHDIWDYDAPNPVVLFDVHDRRRACARRSRRSARPAGPTSSIAQTGKPLDRHRRAAGAAGAAAGDRRDAAVPARRRVRAAARSRSRPKDYALVNDGRIFTPFVGNDPTIVEAGHLGRRELAAERLRSGAAAAVRLRLVGGQRLHRRRRSDVRGAGDRATVTSAARRRSRALARTRHLRRARRDDQQARVALPVARAVLQRHARDRRRPAVRRPQRRPPHRARLGDRQAALGVPDRRRHARAGEHVRAQRQAVRRGVLGRQRADRLRARRQRLAVRSRRDAAAGAARRAGVTTDGGAGAAGARPRRRPRRANAAPARGCEPRRAASSSTSRRA